MKRISAISQPICIFMILATIAGCSGRSNNNSTMTTTKSIITIKTTKIGLLPGEIIELIATSSDSSEIVWETETSNSGFIKPATSPLGVTTFQAPGFEGDFNIIAKSRTDVSARAVIKFRVTANKYDSWSMNSPMDWRYSDSAQKLSIHGPAHAILPDESILITGGVGPNKSAEVYNPGANQKLGGSIYISDMISPRMGHSATLLLNGKVLLAGGNGDLNQNSTAEIYDPITRTFTPTGNMTGSRYGHTATLLENGKVLIAGGQPNSVANGWALGKALASAELFDPTADGGRGAFFKIQDMYSSRLWHQATRLKDGRVLINGGWSHDSESRTETAEYFDPNTATFKPSSKMPYPIFRHTSTLLSDGRVLLSGGSHLTWDFSKFSEYGSNYMYIFDPTSNNGRGEFIKLQTEMNTNRYGHESILVGGNKVILVGCGNSADIYDVATASIKSIPLIFNSSNASQRVFLAGSDGILIFNSTTYFTNGRVQMLKYN